MSEASAAEITLTIAPAAYAHIDSSAGSADLRADARNWQAFTTAADEVTDWPLGPKGSLSPNQAQIFKSFQAWEQLNIAATGAANVDRTHFGNALSAWPEGFPSDNTTRPMVVYAMLAGQHFMNFCASLKRLADWNETTATALLWTDLEKQLDEALKEESGSDFIRPAVLAVIRLCGRTPLIQGPTSGEDLLQTFAVAISL